jgi:hypothetical protein
MVSGRTIATTSRTDGIRIVEVRSFGVHRRSTLTCCRRTRFSASSVALALKREARIPRISLNSSVIRMRATPSACCVYAESNFRYTQAGTAAAIMPSKASLIHAGQEPEYGRMLICLFLFSVVATIPSRIQNLIAEK